MTPLFDPKSGLNEKLDAIREARLRRIHDEAVRAASMRRWEVTVTFMVAAANESGARAEARAELAYDSDFLLDSEITVKALED